MGKKTKIMLIFFLIAVAAKCIAYDHSIFVQAEFPGYNVWLLGYNHLVFNRRLTISVDAGGRLLTPAWLTEASVDLHYNITDLYYAGLGNTFIAADMDADRDHAIMLSFAEPQAGVHIGLGDRLSIFAELGYMWFYKTITDKAEKDEGLDIVIPSYITIKAGFEYWL